MLLEEHVVLVLKAWAAAKHLRRRTMYCPSFPSIVYEISWSWDLRSNSLKKQHTAQVSAKQVDQNKRMHLLQAFNIAASRKPKRDSIELKNSVAGMHKVKDSASEVVWNCLLKVCLYVPCCQSIWQHLQNSRCRSMHDLQIMRKLLHQELEGIPSNLHKYTFWGNKDRHKTAFLPHQICLVLIFREGYIAVLTIIHMDLGP